MFPPCQYFGADIESSAETLTILTLYTVNCVGPSSFSANRDSARPLIVSDSGCMYSFKLPETFSFK